MKKIRLTTKQITAFWFLLFILLLPAGANASGTCPDQDTLTRNARIALVEAQKQINENKSKSARQTLEKFNLKFPDENHPFVAYTLAGLLIEENLLPRALIQYQKTIDMCPTYAPAWQNTGKLCFDLQKFNRAALAMEKAYEFSGKKNHALLFHAAVAHISDKRPEKALSHMLFLASGRAGTPKTNWIKFMANLSIELNQSQKAIKIIENLLAKKNPEPYLFRLVTSLYLDLNLYREAAKALSVYSMLTPLTISENTLLANLYNNIGIPFKAAQLYEKVVEKKPEQKIYERLTSAWIEACKPEQALIAVEKGLAAYPKFQSLWRQKGWIHYENKDYGKAAKAFSRASALKKTDTKSLFMLGLCAYKAGQYDHARKALKKAAQCSQYKNQSLTLIRQMEHAMDKS